MKSLNTKLVLSALGIALLATPAFAQRTHRQAVQDQGQWSAYQTAPTYPNGAIKSGSAESVQSGAEFNEMR